MSIYRQRAALKRHKSNLVVLGAKMLLFYIFLISCCFSGLMGNATEEFQANFKDLLVALAKEKVFLPIPAGKFQCNLVPCHLEKTMQWLKNYFKNDQMRTPISLMEKNKDHIVSALNKKPTKPKEVSVCPVVEKSSRQARRSYRRFFQKLQEKC